MSEETIGLSERFSRCVESQMSYDMGELDAVKFCNDHGSLEEYLSNPRKGFDQSVHDAYRNIHENIQRAQMTTGGASPVLIVVEPGGTPEQISAAQLSVMQASSVLSKDVTVSVGTDAQFNHSSSGFAIGGIEKFKPVESGDESVVGALSKYAHNNNGIVIHFGDVKDPQVLGGSYGAIVGIYPSELDIKTEPSLKVDAKDIRQEVEFASNEVMPQKGNEGKGLDKTFIVTPLN